MSSFVCESIVQSGRTSERLYYTLEDNSFFYQTAYKILQNQAGDAFIPCYKSAWNGKVRLSYPLSAYHTLYSYKGQLLPEHIIQIITEIYKNVDSFKMNGLIQTETIDLSYDSIFLDDNLGVHMICVPLAISSTPETQMSFELAMKSLICEIIEKAQCQQDEGIISLYQDCREGMNSSDDIFLNLKMKKYSTGVNRGNARKIRLVGITNGQNLIIDMAECILGKSPEYAHKVIEGSSSVSRKHCRIFWMNGQFYIEDMGSLNHTYVNGSIVKNGEYIPLQAGDVIQIADLQYEVQ